MDGERHWVVEEPSIGNLVRSRASSDPEHRVARFEDGRQFTFAELDAASNRIANGLDALGAAPGSRVALMLPNCAEFVSCHIGISKLGAIEVPLNTALSGVLLRHPLVNSGCETIFLTAEMTPRLAAIANQLPDLEHVIVVGGGDSQAVPGTSVIGFDEWQAASSELDPAHEPIDTDTAAILFTSGTTGPAKGAELGSRATFIEASEVIKMMEYEAGEVIFTPLPLFHAIARYCVLWPAIMLRGTAVIYERFSASRYWRTVVAEEATAMTYVGSIITVLSKQPPNEFERMHRVTKGYGAPAPEALTIGFKERFGVQLVEPYGGTEAGIVTRNTLSDWRLGSCGKPPNYFEVEIHDEHEQPCPPGVEGEICVRTKVPHSMFSGYHGMAEATLESMRNLWFHSGDRGRTDEDGYFYFVDRMKDCIRHRGHNISSWEIEQAVATYPGVLECAAIGVPSELSEEDVAVAVVEREEGSVEPQRLVAFLRDLLPGFAMPRYVRIVNSLPKNASQRVQKFQLREQGVTLETWDCLADATSATGDAPG